MSKVTVEEAREIVEADDQLTKLCQVERRVNEYLGRRREEANDVRSKSQYASALAHIFGDSLSSDIASALQESRADIVHKIEDFVVNQMKTKREELADRLSKMQDGKWT